MALGLVVRGLLLRINPRPYGWLKSWCDILQNAEEYRFYQTASLAEELGKTCQQQVMCLNKPEQKGSSITEWEGVKK